MFRKEKTVSMLMQFTREVAEHLGWRAEPDRLAEFRAVLVSPDSERLVVQEAHGPKQDRLRITTSMLWIKQRWYGEPLKITVAVTKTPAQVAKEIQRRLLPGYRTMIEQARAEHEREVAAENRRQQLLGDLRVALGPEAEVLPHFNRVRLGDGPDRIEVRVAGGSVEFDVHTTDARAVELAECLALFTRSQTAVKHVDTFRLPEAER